MQYTYFVWYYCVIETFPAFLDIIFLFHIKEYYRIRFFFF